MTTLEILKEARRRIARPRMWIQGWGRVPAGGDGETCAVGAVRVAAGLASHPTGRGYSDNQSEIKAAVDSLARVIGGTRHSEVIGYNDTHTKKCVLTMFDTAIEREEQKETK